MQKKFIENTSAQTLDRIKKKSAYGMPSNPSTRGWSADEIKGAFWRPLLDEKESIQAELERVINEINVCLVQLYEALETGTDLDVEALSQIINELRTIATEAGTKATAAAESARKAEESVKTELSAHNVSEEAHSDLRLLLQELTDRLNAVADSDDTTLDQLSEIVEYIKANKTLIETFTSKKVNVADIIDNLTSRASNRPLSARQGAVLKDLIDAIVVPTKTSQLVNDSNFISEHQDLSNYVEKSDLSAHNTDEEAHNDLRIALDNCYSVIKSLLDTNDDTLNQTSEIVAYIKNNKSLIDAITTSKVSVTAIVDNLTTSLSDKVLSAKQGVALKALIDALTTGKVSKEDVVDNLSSTADNKPLSAKQGAELKKLIDQLTTEKLNASALQAAINQALADAKASGEFDGKDYVLTDNDKTNIADKVRDGDIPSYWKSALEAGAEAINTALCTAGMKKSAFLFYSDAHWNYGSQMSPRLLKYLYNHTGMTKTFFGGDIVNNEATDYDTMSYLWDWRRQLKDLPNHHSVAGNHDDGNATNNLFSEQYVYGYLFAAEETPDIVRGGVTWYYIDSGAEKTRYIFLDTAYKGMTSDQIEFLKQALIGTENGWHIVVVSHIWRDTIYPDANAGITDYGVGDFSTDGAIALAILDNYNSRIGDYADCGGWVEFCIGGHTHIDHTSTSSTGIPVILVETDSMHVRSGLGFTAGTTTEASVNGIIADYDNHKIYVVRIGRGESREVEITNYVVSYTNVLPMALAADGKSVYNGKGWKENTRWSGSGNTESTSTGIYLTGYIPVSGTDTIYLKKITMPTGTSNDTIVHLFKSLDDANEANSNGSILDEYHSAVRDANGNLIQFKVAGDYKYIRIQCGGITDASIITINEPIE